MSFRVGQYNIFADYLADNFRPWLWYGFVGIIEPTTQLEEQQLEIWGKGRSKLQIKFWCLMKKYAKLFDTEFPYNLERLEKYSVNYPSRALIHGLQRAIEAFFYRNNMTSPIGKSDTTPYLFDRCQAELELWNEAAKSVRLDIPMDDEVWETLDILRWEMAEEKDPNEIKHKLDLFNEELRDFWGSDSELSRKIRDLASLMSPNDRDLNAIIKNQKSFLWENRGPAIIKQIMALNCDIWGLEEIDKLDYIRANLQDHLKLAVYRYRKIDIATEGEAIFYNPKTFEIYRQKGRLAIGSVRYSGEAKFNGEREIQLQEETLWLSDNVILPENAAQDDEKAEALPGWKFTENVTRRTKAYYDERVGIFTILKHKKTKTNFLFVCTHLYHSQNNARHEKIRELQIQQLLQALAKFKEIFSCPDIATIFVADLNDVPSMEIFGRDGHSKVYSTLIEERFIDVFADDPSPTSTTLSRSVSIDYIWTHNLKNWKSEPDPKMPIRCMAIGDDEKMTLLPPGVTDGATVCPPMPACDLGGTEKQDAIPSDHIPIATTFIEDLNCKI